MFQWKSGITVSQMEEWQIGRYFFRKNIRIRVGSYLSVKYEMDMYKIQYLVSLVFWFHITNMYFRYTKYYHSFLKDVQNVSDPNMIYESSLNNISCWLHGVQKCRNGWYQINAMEFLIFFLTIVYCFNNSQTFTSILSITNSYEITLSKTFYFHCLPINYVLINYVLITNIPYHPLSSIRSVRNCHLWKLKLKLR